MDTATTIESDLVLRLRFLHLEGKSIFFPPSGRLRAGVVLKVSPIQSSSIASKKTVSL